MVEASDTRWDVNRTLRLLPEICLLYAADFDGDEMSVFPIKEPFATEECSTLSWSYGHTCRTVSFLSKLFQKEIQI
jgi:hypothetical protein